MIVCLPQEGSSVVDDGVQGDALAPQTLRPGPGKGELACDLGIDWPQVGWAARLESGIAAADRRSTLQRWNGLVARVAACKFQTYVYMHTHLYWLVISVTLVIGKSSWAFIAFDCTVKYSFKIIKWNEWSQTFWVERSIISRDYFTWFLIKSKNKFIVNIFTEFYSE